MQVRLLPAHPHTPNPTPHSPTLYPTTQPPTHPPALSSRCLAGFEADPGRAAAMHRCRAQLLEPLSGGLNPDHYPGLSRSIDLELAHIYREVSDVRELQAQSSAAAAAAAAAGAGGGGGGKSDAKVRGVMCPGPMENSHHSTAHPATGRGPQGKVEAGGVPCHGVLCVGWGGSAEASARGVCGMWERVRHV